jgi:DNA-binding winged helix-turn-helix (wHTH) protein
MNEPSTYNKKYRFSTFTLDLNRGALLSSGSEISLCPKTFEVSRYLVERHGELVSRRELLDVIWKNTVVTEDSVSHCIAEIRKALDDNDRGIIRTVPRRGYIFRLPVDTVELQDWRTDIEQRINACMS